LRWRQAIPPVFVTGIILMTVMAIFFPIVWIPLGSIFFLYVLILVFGSLSVIGKKTNGFCLLGIPIAIVVMHFSWGLGFLYSFTTGMIKKEKYG
jgi:hypothetical protein